jgi:hypothetical protein
VGNHSPYSLAPGVRAIMSTTGFRLDNGRFSVVVHDGSLYVKLWLEGGKPTDDPLCVAVSPGEALELVLLVSVWRKARASSQNEMIRY